MTDLAQSDVHGPVETLRTEFAEWDPAAQVWKPPQHHTLLRFRPDGKLKESEFHNPDGSIARSSYIYDEAGRLIETRFRRVGEITGTSMYYSYDTQGRPIRTESADEKGTRTELETYHYDPSGRKTKIQFMPKHEDTAGVSYDIGASMMLSAAAAATMTTSYDDRDQPTEVLAHDATHNLLQRMISTYDSDGRLVKEEVRRGAGHVFPGMEDAAKSLSPEDRERMHAIVEKFFSQDNAFATTTYAYDQKGRRTDKTVRMSILSDEHTTYRFDDHDNPIEEVTEGSNRDMSLDPEGNVQSSQEDSIHQHTRYSYTYDSRGNWTERVVWIIFPPDKDFRRSNVERRQITYYLAAAA